MISLQNPTAELMATIEELRQIAQNNTEWLQQLPASVLSKAGELVNEQGYPLSDIRDFIESYGYVAFLEGYYETWADLTDDGYDNEAIEAFIEDNSIEDIDNFEEAYCGEFGTIREVVEWVMELNGQELPSWLVVDYESTWQCNLRHDFIFESGYLFHRDF